jgi:hypothetical protein
VSSYDRTEVLLNTFAWWSDDDGATADRLPCGRVAPDRYCRPGGVDDARLVIGFAEGGRSRR